MPIELSQEEVTLLRTLLERRIGELGPEIHHTRTLAYRDELERLREQLTNLQQRLSQAAA
jgi:hypothetical protein